MIKPLYCYSVTVFYLSSIRDHLSIAWKTSQSPRDLLVREYSTLGGISSYCLLIINPSYSSALSCSVRTFLEIPSTIWWILPKRNVSFFLIALMMGNFHLPPNCSVKFRTVHLSFFIVQLLHERNHFLLVTKR